MPLRNITSFVIIVWAHQNRLQQMAKNADLGCQKRGHLYELNGIINITFAAKECPPK